MNLWQKLTGNGVRKSDEPEIQLLETQLERLKYQARPEFQADLKNRLLASLEQEPVPPTLAPKFLQQVKTFLSGPNLTRLAVSGFGMAALVVLVISVLAANSLSNSKSTPQSPPVAAATVPNVTPQANKTAGISQNLHLFSPTSRTYLTAAEASRQLGFAVREPNYLPANYKLEAAYLGVNNGPGVVLPIQGYQLNYQAPGLNGKPRELEIAEWQPPTLTKTVPGSITGRTTPAIGFGVVNGAKASMVELSKGLPAYYLEGSKWQIALSGSVQVIDKNMPVTGAGSVVVSSVISSTDGPPLPPEAVAIPIDPVVSTNAVEVNPPGSPDFSISIGRPAANRSDVYLEFGNSSSQEVAIRTLMWQQNNRLFLVSADESISLDELKKVALGFLESR